MPEADIILRPTMSAKWIPQSDLLDHLIDQWVCRALLCWGQENDQFPGLGTTNSTTLCSLWGLACSAKLVGWRGDRNRQKCKAESRDIRRITAGTFGVHATMSIHLFG